MRPRPNQTETDPGGDGFPPMADGWFNRGRIWIGRHAVDHDVLVFDPSVSDPAAANLTFYSLSQFRNRTFPRALAEQRVREITDKAARAEAEARYADRGSLKAAQETTRTEAREEQGRRFREWAVAAHGRYLKDLGIENQGVRDTTGETLRPRRSKCASCGIAVDNFVATVCVGCNDLLCTCGACACGTKTRAKSPTKTAAKTPAKAER